MAKNDQWCELCEDKTKGDIVKINGKELGVCNHCKSLCNVDESPNRRF